MIQHQHNRRIAHLAPRQSSRTASVLWAPTGLFATSHPCAKLQMEVNLQRMGEICGGNMPEDISGLNATLEKIQQFGILQEDADKIVERLELAVVDAASRQTSGDLGLREAVSGFLTRLKAALHQELCDPQRKALKERYSNLLDKGLTADGIQAVAAVVSKIVAAINPTYLVSSIVVYASIWLLKVGLNHWCSLPSSTGAD
jgi:hypothetical protein